MQRPAFLLVLFLSSSLVAQSDGWVPPAHTRRAGNNGIAMPGNWSLGRLQVILDKADLPAAFLPPRLLTKIAYRRTAYPTIINNTYPAKTLMMEVSMGNSQIPGNAMISSYASNQPGDITIVLPLGNVNFPVDPPVGAFNEVGPDIMIFPFTTPKIFSGPHLFIEHVNNMPPLAVVDYWTDMLDNRVATLNGHNVLRGQFGCGTAMLPTLLRAPTATNGNALGTSTTYTLAAATGSTAFLLNLGFRLDRPYGVPAPFDLAPIGAPGCPFWNSLEVISIGATTAAGDGNMVVPWPSDPTLSGLEVGLQALVISPGFNAAGITTSNGIDAWIGARFPLVSSMVLGTSLTAATGTLYLGGAPITHLYWL